jgi:hypothetical protein
MWGGKGEFVLVKDANGYSDTEQRDSDILPWTPADADESYSHSKEEGAGPRCHRRT